MTETILSLDFGIPLYAGRGIAETWGLDASSSKQRRTVNGRLDDLALSEFRKFALSYSCADRNAPALSGVWPGRIVAVDAIQEFAYATLGGSPDRTVVPGSSRVEGDYTFYRMRLTMRVINFQIQRDEWNATTTWTLDLLEI